MLTTDELILWAAVAAIFISLASIAWSGVQLVGLKKIEQRQRSFSNFFVTIDRILAKDTTNIGQIAAIFELRNYPDYKDFIIRFVGNARILFNTDPKLQSEQVKLTYDEMDRVVEHLKSNYP
jgi:hypothetical protein